MNVQEALYMFKVIFFRLHRPRFSNTDQKILFHRLEQRRWDVEAITE